MRHLLAAAILPICAGMHGVSMAHTRPLAVLPRAVVAAKAAAPAKAASPASGIAKQLTESEEASGLAEPEGWVWLDGSGIAVPSFDGVLDQIRLAHAARSDLEVHVGCDSAVQRGDSIVFATVVCLISKTNGGGRYFYARTVEKRRRFPVLQTRLLREVELSLSTAELLTANDIDVATVHCDSNTDPTCRSTEHTRMLVGYIQVRSSRTWHLRRVT